MMARRRIAIGAGHPKDPVTAKHKEITSKVISAINRLTRDCESDHLKDALNLMILHQDDIRRGLIKLKT